MLPGLVLCDDLDARISELPPEYAQLLIQRWEQILRGSTSSTIILTAMRATGPVGRLLDALPRRALLRAASRVDHIAAGAESTTFDEQRPAGRVRIDGREAQFAWVPGAGAPPVGAVAPAVWLPSGGVSALVTAGAAALAPRMREAYPEAEVVVLGGAGEEPATGATTGRPRIILGDTDAWQREWSLWQRVRAEGEALVRAERPSDLRQLVGLREVPPFARAHAGRVWAVRGADLPRRAMIPALAGHARPTTPNVATAASPDAGRLTRRSRRDARA